MFKVEAPGPAESAGVLEVQRAFTLGRQRRDWASPGRLHLEEVFTELLDIFLQRNCPMKRAVRRAERLAKRKGLNAPTKLILDQTAPRTRHIPTQLRDEVYIKDGCRCTYVSPSGVRCTAREQLEIDHIRPFSAGGKTVLGNLRLRCKQHNLLAAEQFYGKEKIEQFRRCA